MRDSSIEIEGAGTGEIDLSSGKGFSLAAFLFFGEVKFLMATGLVRKLEPCSLGDWLCSGKETGLQVCAYCCIWVSAPPWPTPFEKSSTIVLNI